MKETSVFHPSLEAVQHGGKKLFAELIPYVKETACSGVQLSHFHLLKGDGTWEEAGAVKQALGDTELSLDGISAHCLFWVHGSAWTGTRSIRNFIPADVVATQSFEGIEQWAEARILELMDLSAALGNKVVPMFWGLYYGLEVGSGYPWGMWSGPGYDYIAEGDDRFVRKTERIRQHARDLGISLAHEIHPGTAAMCGTDFLHLVKLCGGDPSLGVNADPSHCWEGEDMETRFRLVGDRVTGCHVKDHVCVPGRSRRSMDADWKSRGMQFCMLGTGQIDLHRYVQLMIEVGYPQRYCKLQHTATAPLVGEAESAHYALDHVSKEASAFIDDHLCLPVAAQSFEKGMAADAKK